MKTESFAHVSLAIEVDECDPQVIDIYDGDRIGVTLLGGPGSHAVYLRGTHDELHWLCDKLRATVTAHESATTLAGDAAARVAFMNDCDHPWLDANNDDYLECRRCGKRFTESDSLPERASTLETS